MFEFILAIHSIVRWLVLFSLSTALIAAYQGKKNTRAYSSLDKKIGLVTLSIVHLQTLLGIILYFMSPMVNYFLKNFKDAVHMRDIRFFGMEHITMMVIAVTVITIGSLKVKRRNTDQEKFRTTLIWFLVAFVIIVLSIPWSFSPFTSRPLFRTL